jgi:hypothetical protein
MTIAAFLEKCAARFDAAPNRDHVMACQCRSYATIAAHLEAEDALRRERAAAAAPVRVARERAAERVRRAKKSG